MTALDDFDPLRHGNLDAPVDPPPGHRAATIQTMATDTKRAPRDDDSKTDTPTAERKPKAGADEPIEPVATTYAGNAQYDAIPLNTETHGNYPRHTASDI